MKFELRSTRGGQWEEPPRYLSGRVYEEKVPQKIRQRFEKISRYGPKGHVYYSKGDPVFEEYWENWLANLRARDDILDIVLFDDRAEYTYYRRIVYFDVDSLDQLLDYIREINIEVIIFFNDETGTPVLEVYDGYRE